MLPKHAARTISPPTTVREISMPPAQPSPSAPSRPHQVLPFPTRLRSAPPARGNCLRATAGLTAKAGHACLSSSFALFGWMLGGFLDGFAVYAMAMYGIPPIAANLGLDDDRDRLPAEPPHAAAPRRPQVATTVRLVTANNDRRP